MAENKLEFSVDSQLLGELGERLVTRNYIALSELVKNAYDADATTITIRLINAKKGGSKNNEAEIHLIDNGHGMTFREVKDYWMRIATPYKVREPISQIYGRRKTGNKGIGRFACQRLAKKLIFETIARIPSSKDLEWTKVEFDWEKFEPGTTLTEIPCEYQTKQLSEGSPGLKLILKGLNEAWSEAEFNLLRRQLLTISIIKGMRRKGFNEDPGFDIRFEAPEFPKGEGVLVDQFMDAGWGKLEGSIKENGAVTLKLEAKKIGAQHFILPDKFNILKHINFEIAWVPIKKGYFRDTKTLTIGIAKKAIEQFGVRVYLDGFRIYPYGNPGDDWLGIDKDVARRRGTVNKIFDDLASKLQIDRSRVLLSHPQNRNLIGRILISSDLSRAFSVKLDREGFVENEAFNELVRCIRLSLEWLTLYYNKFTLLVKEEALKKSRDKFEEELKKMPESDLAIKGTSASLLDRAIEVLSLEAKMAQDNLQGNQKKDSEKRVLAASEYIKHSFSLAETQLGLLGARASTDDLMFVFSHEIKSLIARIETHAHTIERIIKKIPDNQRAELLEFSKSLLDTRDRFDQQIKFFGIMAEKTHDIQRKRIQLKNSCVEIVKGFDYLIDHYGLNPIKIEVPDSLRTGEMLDAELFSVLVNTISNALKANLAGNGRNILVKGNKEAGKTIIYIYDDGIGISKASRELVFEPLVVDPDKILYKKLEKRIQDKDLSSLGRGTGLGLGILKVIAESYGGKVGFIDVKPPWKTCIRVELP